MEKTLSELLAELGLSEEKILNIVDVDNSIMDSAGPRTDVGH